MTTNVVSFIELNDNTIAMVLDTFEDRKLIVKEEDVIYDYSEETDSFYVTDIIPCYVKDEEIKHSVCSKIFYGKISLLDEENEETKMNNPVSKIEEIYLHSYKSL